MPWKSNIDEAIMLQKLFHWQYARMTIRPHRDDQSAILWSDDWLAAQLSQDLTFCYFVGCDSLTLLSSCCCIYNRKGKDRVIFETQILLFLSIKGSSGEIRCPGIRYPSSNVVNKVFIIHGKYRVPSQMPDRPVIILLTAFSWSLTEDTTAKSFREHLL